MVRTESLEVKILPEGTNLIHIGPQKTGSTTIQNALHETRAVLREHGVVHPGRHPRPPVEALGFHARLGAPPRSPRQWKRLLREISEAGEQRVCVSHEVFGRASDEQIPQIISSLGGERPHILAVARRYDRYLPSQWQQRVKARETRSYEEWLGIVLKQRSRSYVWSNVWVPHDTVQLARRWGEHVGLENMTVLVGDESDRALLPGVFERMLGLPTGTLAIETRSNRSLSHPEVELLRRLVLSLRAMGASREEYYEFLRRGMIRHLVTLPYPQGEPRVPPLPPWALERVVELSDRRVAGLHELRDSGLNVIGELEDLRVDPTSPTADSTAAPESVSMETAARALEGLALGARSLSKRAVREQAAEQAAELAAEVGREQSAPTPSPGGAVVRKLVQRLGRVR